MKRILALLLALLMTLSIVACSTAESDKSGGTSGKKSDTSDVADKEEEEVKTLKQATRFCMGTVSGKIYENEFIGIGCEVPSDWTFKTDDEIMELNNISAEAAGEDYQALVEKADVYTDMFVASEDATENINVNLQKVDKKILEEIDMKEYYEATVATIESSYENMGGSGFEYNVSSVFIDGVEFECMNVSVELSGVGISQTAIAIKCNGYMANVTCTAGSEDEVADIIETFYLL